MSHKFSNCLDLSWSRLKICSIISNPQPSDVRPEIRTIGWSSRSGAAFIHHGHQKKWFQTENTSTDGRCSPAAAQLLILGGALTPLMRPCLCFHECCWGMRSSDITHQILNGCFYSKSIRMADDVVGGSSCSSGSGSEDAKSSEAQIWKVRNPKELLTHTWHTVTQTVAYKHQNNWSLTNKNAMDFKASLSSEI